MPRYSRRDLLSTSACVAGMLAGCLGDRGADESETPVVYTSFFTLYDFTRNITGDTLSVANAVPARQHGHGWEPPIDLLPEIVEADAFVYLDAQGFQPWAEKAATEIRRNYADEVQLIDVIDGIDLLQYDSGHHSEFDHDPDEYEYGTVAEVEIIDQKSEDFVAHFHFDHWHGSIPDIKEGSSLLLIARFTDVQGEVVPLSEDGPYSFTARIAEGDPGDVLAISSKGDHIQLESQSIGETSVVFELRTDDEITWETGSITVSVIDAGPYDPDRDHGAYDVKFFSDPVLAQSGVRNIRDGLIELDPAKEDLYLDRAEKYIGKLDQLHKRYQETLSNREHELVVLAGHDSFHYLGTRYGFEIHTPVGLSEDDEPSTRDLASAIELVEKHDIEYVLWDYFDGDDIAESIANEVNTVKGIEMVSAAESYIPEWKEEGEGEGDYIWQMAEINLPAFKKALGAE